MANGKARQVTQFYEVEPGISFKDFNMYINGLGKEDSVMKKTNIKKQQ